MVKDYLLKDEDELVLTGFQLREWKEMIIEDYKSKEYPNTAFRRGRRKGYLQCIKNFEKITSNWDVEPCCHGIRQDDLMKLFKQVQEAGDKRFKITKEQRLKIQKYRSEIPKRTYWSIAKELGLSEFQCVYWGNAETRRKHQLKTRKRKFGKNLGGKNE
jgi:hypothetical protein